MENLQHAETDTTPATKKERGPCLYVGTYGKYNRGSIAGAWLDLEDYADAEDFYNACAALHADECDPEYMFQDYENLPEYLYSECGGVELIYEFLELDYMEREAVAAWLDNINTGDSFSYIIGCFQGCYDDEMQFAEQLLHDCDGFNDIPQHLQHFFDYESYRDSLFCNSFVSARTNKGCFVFNNQ